MPRNRRRECVSQANRIELLGRPVEDPCSFCLRRGLQCIIVSMDPKNQKCSACTRRNQKCENRFHSENEWKKLEQAKTELSAELRVTRAIFAEHSRKLTDTLARIERLEKHENFLNDRGIKMLGHDTAVSERLDEDDPPSVGDLREIERLAEEHDSARLAAVADFPSLSQIGSPSFWVDFDSSPGGTVLPCRDNPPSAQ